MPHVVRQFSPVDWPVASVQQALCYTQPLRRALEDQPIAPNDGFYWAFLALLGWGCADYLARSASGRFGSVSVTLLTLTIGLAVPLPFVLVEISRGSLAVDWSELAVWGLVTGAFLGVAYLVYYTGLQRGSVTVVSTAASAWLAVTVVIAVAAFGESLSLGQGALMAVVLAGILMLSVGRANGTGVRTGLAWGLEPCSLSVSPWG